MRGREEGREADTDTDVDVKADVGAGAGARAGLGDGAGGRGGLAACDARAGPFYKTKSGGSGKLSDPKCENEKRPLLTPLQVSKAASPTHHRTTATREGAGTYGQLGGEGAPAPPPV